MREERRGAIAEETTDRESNKKGEVESLDKKGSVIFQWLKDRSAPLLLLLPVCRYE